jgi:hypothetical protein
LSQKVLDIGFCGIYDSSHVGNYSVVPRKPKEKLMTTNITLWRFHKITGYWKVERQCGPLDAEAWQRVYSQDEPSEHFYISKRKPTFNPIPKHS